MEWTVPGTVVRVVDGDTIVCDLDLGWHVKLRAAIRVDGLASPELNTSAGKVARDYAATLLPIGAPVRVVSKRLLGSTEKYGRVLADLSFELPQGQRAIDSSYALAMIAAGCGEPWDGSGKQPA